MDASTSKYRLRSSAFIRQDEINENKIEPKRMIILSVEGDDTERNYFERLNAHLDNTIIQIEVLRHKKGDGYSDPVYVLELLEEYIDVRGGLTIPEEMPKELTEKYSQEFIRKYLKDKDSLDVKLCKSFKEDLLKAGIDIEYRQYLQTFNKESDYFAIIIDRDDHSRELLEECKKICDEKDYGYFLTNPCFEFWLLLHLSDIKKEFSVEELQKMYENPKISNNHTFVSLELTKKAHHKKSISSKSFEKYYYPNIQNAIDNAKMFSSDFPELLDNLGTNITELMGILLK